MPGDYTLNNIFFTNYDELNDFEIGFFKEHSDPFVLVINLIGTDIYSRQPTHFRYEKINDIRKFRI